MKLGLYGGGFKPFHTGHFAKLLLALDEADKVVSFFGIKKQKFSKKTGKPLKTKFRSFGNAPDARVFNQEMQEEVVSIYEDALENAFQGSLDIVPSADETPITKIFNVLSNFAYQSMDNEERENLTEEVPEISIGQNFEGFSMNNVDEIIVVAGPEEVASTYMSGINRMAAKSMLGEKVKDLVDSGIIRFETGSGNQQRLVDLLGKYKENASEEDVLVRGSDVRSMAADKDIDSLLRYIPSIIPKDQRDLIVKILMGEDDSASQQQSESFIMPIVTDTTVLRAAARFTSSKPSKKKIVEQKKKGEDHILGLTEDMSMTFDNLRQLIRDVLTGRVEHVEEKMDGQNFTFTINRGGEVRIFGKGITATALDKGGKGRKEIKSAYEKNENLYDAFISAYDVVEKYISQKESSLLDRMFQDGRVVVEGQIMTPINPNTIPYTENHVRFVRPFTPDELEIDKEAYESLFGDDDIEIQDQDGRPWSFGPVPKLRQTTQDATEIQNKIQDLELDIENLLSDMSPPPKNIGEFAAYAMESYIKDKAPEIKLQNLNPDQKKRALERLATGNKSIIGKKELANFWPEIQKFEKLRTAHVAAAIVDLEKIVQKLGTYFFETLEFALATNEDVVADLAAEVEKIKHARESDQISIKNSETGSLSDLVDTAWATKLDSSLSCVEQMDMFKKAVEGVVLRMPSPEGVEIVRKLTGMFTPVHRLVSLFRYPDRYSREVLFIEKEDDSLTDEEIEALNETLRVIAQNLQQRSSIVEGGNAFRPRDSRGRPTGPPVTTDERIPRDVATRITDEIIKNVINPLALKHLAVGSTATNKEEIGDIDLTVSEPSVEKLVSNLQTLDYLQAELVDGIPRVSKLPGGRAATIMIEYQGKYYQVDLFTSTDINDTAWELSGGGEGEVKGVYRNLMLSLLAKIKSEKESTPEKTMKYTVSFPGGWREKIDGKENASGGVIDPDRYLPLIGIDSPKSDIRNFESLIDYMASRNLDEFIEAFERFEDYISNRINSKSEKTRKEAVQAIDYISGYHAGEEQNIQELYDIIEVLLESEESKPDEAADPPDESSSPELLDFNSQKSFSGKMKVIFKILQRADVLGSDIEKINNQSRDLNLVRFGMKPDVGDNYDFNDITNKIYKILHPELSDSVVELAPYEAPNPSGTYTAYMLPGLGNLIIIFGISGTSGGQRKAGYIYEDELGVQLEQSGMEVRGETDNAYSDIYVKSENGELGIEVKLPNAQAGEPTIRYDFDMTGGGGFFPSNPKPQNKDIANLVNLDPDMKNVQKRMIIIRDAINNLRARSGNVSPIESILGTISREEYVDAVHGAIADSSEGLRIAKYTVSTDSLRTYYMYKGAGVVQVKGKGLYHLHPEFEINLGGERKTLFFDFPPAQGAVYFRNNRGINYAMRTQFSAKPLSKLNQSGINLDNSDDRRDFSNFVSNTSFPSSKSLVEKSPETNDS